MVAAPGVQYGYDSQNKRVWVATVNSNGQLTGQTAYFYGVVGSMLEAYTLTLGSSLTATAGYSAVYFGRKRVGVAPTGTSYSTFIQDRLGSQGTYYPYGEDKGTPLSNDQFKFATYWRDSATSLDYANQRYYVNNFGRFVTPDPYQATAMSPSDPNDPQSWNRYAYVVGDPVNWIDPDGLFLQPPPAPPPPPPAQDQSPTQPPPFVDTGNGGSGGNTQGEKGAKNPNPRPPPLTFAGKPRQSYSACVAQVAQQVHAPYLADLQFLDNNFLTILGIGAWGGAMGGPLAGSEIPIFGQVLGSYLGAHVGALTANEVHTDLTLLFTILANIPPSASAIAAACGPPPPPIQGVSGPGGHR